MDNFYNKVQLQTELRIDFFIKSNSSCTKSNLKVDNKIE